MFDQWHSWRLPAGEGPDGGIAAEVALAYRLTEINASECPAYYLQGIRSGVLRRLGQATDEKYQRVYLAARPQIIEALCSAVSARVSSSFAVVTPPSSREDARPYVDALLGRGLAGRDLSAHLERIDGSFRAGSTDSYSEVLRSLRTVGKPDSDPPRNLIVVDDVLASGRSVAATVLALRRTGFISPETTVFVLAIVGASSHEHADTPPSSPETDQIGASAVNPSSGSRPLSMDWVDLNGLG